MYSEPPLISAIMPTRGRSVYAYQALEMFVVQSYPNKELVIVDDLDERSFPFIPEVPGIKYRLMETRLTIGEKRNIAIAGAAGNIIIHWDSDDMYAPDRIEHQVNMLLSDDVDIVGYNSMTFEEEGGRRYQYRGGEGYMIGVSMCYHRRVWQDQPFRAKNVGEDNDFQFGRRLQKAVCPAGDRIIARIHKDNTSNKIESAAKNPAQWVAV